MTTRSLSLVLIAVVGTIVSTPSQTSSHPTAIKTDYSQESAVIEQMTTKVSFDRDGKRSREQVTRVQINTDAAVQEWGVLSLPYQSAVETVEVGYVRVRKSDSTTVLTPEDNVQDLDSEITRSAPFYSDQREKHIAVKGLGKGDVLEFQAYWHPTKALIPGQFWFEYSFHHEGIVLDERVEIVVPGDRSVKFKGPSATQDVKTENGSKVYSWSYTKLENEKDADSEKKKIAAVGGRIPAPDVQFSSFQSWEEVGAWYWKLQSERAAPSDAVKAKAKELTKGLTDDRAKVQALYNFVSTKYRYIGIAFGIGRYQPHAADDVLSNNYGDCKDKHTLLAALLEASGITLYPALISAGHQLDPDVPSPGQFDHVIGYLPQEKGALWLDTTPEVSPAGYLLPVLRDKSALVMIGDKPAKLINTPSEPPLPNLQTFKIEGKLTDDGTLDAHVEDTTRGDSEVLLRMTFRRVPQAQWKDLVQQLSYALGYSGTVSEVNADSADATSEPFHFSYSYNRKNYPDWSSRQITVPGHPFFMPPVRDDAKEPLWLGALMKTVSESKVELPKAYKPIVPSDVDLKYDFAEYHAKYSQEGSTILATRNLTVKLQEVPAKELDDYRSFIKNLQNDTGRYVQTASSNPANPEPASLGPLARYAAEFQKLPESTVAEANHAEEEARSAMQERDVSGAMKAFQQAVDADPKFTRAWIELAVAQMGMRQNDAGLDSLVKAISADPSVVVSHKLYAFALGTLWRNDAALQAWLETLKIAPEDQEANSSVGWYLMQEKRYTDALPYLEKSVKLDPSTVTRVRLGSAYIKAGQTDKGKATLQRMIDDDPTPLNLNDVAYELADDDVDLPKAAEYAQRAVAEQEKFSQYADLSKLLAVDLRNTQYVGSFWDTLGWVEFREGHLDRAEEHLHAAWLLTQAAVVGDHLGQVYEQDKKTDKAAHMYRLALATPEARGLGSDSDEIRRHLEHLGEKVPSNAIEMIRTGDRSGDELSQLRTVKLKRIVPGSAKAEYFLLIGPGAKVEDTLFITGDESMRGADAALSAAKFEMTFPSGSSAMLVRRAIVMCSPVSGCQAVLYTPSSVNSVR